MKKTISPLLGLLFLGGAVFAQSQDFTCSTNSNGTLTITNYTGPGGNLTIPTNINGLSVTGIAAGVFQFKASLTGVVIPGGITNIGENAFYSCEQLTNVMIGNGVPNIANFMFTMCISLSSVTIPNSVTNIGEFAFDGTGSLSSVTLPQSIISIGTAAFEVSGLTNVIVPHSVGSLGESTFAGCESLTNFTLSNNAIAESMFEACTNLSGSLVIPSNVLSIGDFSFYQCNSLTNLMFSHGVISIGNQAFEGCYGLTNLTLPDSLTSLGSNAFEGSSLTNVSILGSVNIGQYAFNQVPLRSVSIAGGMIGDYAFELCTNLASVSFGDGITSIGIASFYGDPVSSVVIPGSVASIGDFAFEDCLLTNLTISNGVRTIEAYAFLGNPLGSVFLPSTVNITGDQVFFDCVDLTNVTVAAGVANLSYSMFGLCNNLSNVFFLGNAPSIVGQYPTDGSVFRNDTNVTVYYLPGATGWSNTYGSAGGYAGAPTALWNPVIQTGDGGFGVRNGQFGFNITGTAGIPVAVMACTNLANPVWTPLQSLTLTNGAASFSDPNWTNAPARYYGLGFP